MPKVSGQPSGICRQERMVPRRGQETGERERIDLLEEWRADRLGEGLDGTAVRE